MVRHRKFLSQYYYMHVESGRFQQQVRERLLLGCSCRPRRQLLQLTILAAFLQPCFASNFKVQGHVEVTPADGAGNLLWADTKRSQFTVSVRDGEWLLKSITADGHCDLCGCDSTNVYWLAVQTNIPGSAIAEVARGQYPLGPNTIYVSLPWLSFASILFLDSARQSPMPAPWAFPRTDPSAFIYSTDVRRFPAEPTLPEEVIFSVSGPLLKSAINNPLLESGPLNQQVLARSKAFLTRYEPGFIGGHYKVLATTNWNGMRLPSEAELTRYSLNQPAVRVPFEVYRLKVQSVSAPHAESYIPELPANATVLDRRLRDPRLGIDLVQYRTPDGRWRSEADPGLRRLFEERQAMAIFSSSAVHDQRRTLIVRAALGLLVLVPIAALLLRRAYRRRPRAEVSSMHS